MHSLAEILNVCSASERSRYTVEFTKAANSLGCDVAMVRRCGSDHRGEPGYAGQPMSGVHYHIGACVGSLQERIEALLPEEHRLLPDPKRAPVCPRCLDIEPGVPGGDPETPHPGPFTEKLCKVCASHGADALTEPRKSGS
jgi:hypothetical protein